MHAPYMEKLIQELMHEGYLKTDSIIEAFVAVDRKRFVPKDLASLAHRNIPLPIGFGQTISQPLTVAFMLELLQVGKGQVVLDVGSGSGWTTALIAHMVGEHGKVIGMEVMKELCELGEKNIEKFGYIRSGIVEIICKNANEGFEKFAPYDRILVSAASDEVPGALKDQLAAGGKLVMPIGNDLVYFEKREDGSFDRQVFPGFSFVPFVHKSER